MVDRDGDGAERRAERVAEVAIERAVHRTFQLIGVDVNSQESINSFRDNLSYLNKLKEENESRRKETWKTIYAAVIGFVVATAGAWITGLVNLGKH